MILSLGDVISQATTLAGGRNDRTASDVSFWANLSAVEVFNQVYMVPLESLAVSSTTSGENRYTLPSDFDAPISLSNKSWVGDEGRQLDQVEAQWISSQRTTSGPPRNYAIYGGYLELWPPPDSSYSLELRYYAKQPVMMESNATPRFDERWHLGWLYKTAAMLELSRDNPGGASVQLNLYQSYMNSIPNDLAAKQRAKAGMSLRYQRGAS